MLLKISIALSAIALIIMATVTYIDLENHISDIVLLISMALLSSSSLVAAFCPIFLYKSQYTSLNYETIISGKLKVLESSQNKLN